MAALIAVLAYWTGLQGPFLLDDVANLSAIPEWLDGKLGLPTLLFERGAGVFGRPLSMATFAFNAWVAGVTPFSFKLGNLLVHLVCGGVIFGFIRRLLRRSEETHPTSSLMAAMVAALWLLHPLHASTVLYAVQRMAQMATLFTLLGLWWYLAMRERLERAPSVSASAGLLLGIPAFTVLAVLSKENGALLPLLCMVLELTWFREGGKPWPVRACLVAYVALPILAALAMLVVMPQRFIGGYAGRDFTLAERLLSQGRALCDYLWKLIAPNPPTMGVYTDDFPVSTGLVAPPATLVALFLLASLSVIAWRMRNKMPAVCFGWFFFLAAHSLEASIIPLELYFEHRNYLPSVGILLAIVALVTAAGRALRRKGLRSGRIGAILAVGILAVYAFGLHGRALVWRSNLLIAESSLLFHPHSLRATVAVMTSSLAEGDRTRADQMLGALLTSPIPRQRSLGHAFRLMVECEFDRKGRPEDLRAFVETSPLPLTQPEQQPFELMYHIVGKQGCTPFNDHTFGVALAELADRADTSGASGGGTGRLRHQASAFLLRAEDWHAALAQAKLAWSPDADLPVAVELIMAQLKTGDLPGAEQTWLEAEARLDRSNTDEQAMLAWLRTQIKQYREENLEISSAR